MHWSFGHLTFDADRGVVRNGTEQLLLEPKASALLNYLCQNAQRDISRDELMKHVWHGQIVSDNAVNRVIVQLRKALGDEGKPRKFIATVPKVGYRFIGQPNCVQADAVQPNAIGATDSARVVWPLTVFGLLAFALLVAAWVSHTPDPGPNMSIEPISREAGRQFDADLSPGENYLLFSMAERQGNVLYVQDLNRGQLTRVSSKNGNAYGARWSHDGEYFVYIYHQGEQCSFRKVSINVDGSIAQNSLLQTCSLNTDTTFALSLDDEILYFVERPNTFSPYVAYALDMQEQQRWRLAQPLPTSFGNHYLDVHPQSGKVLLLSEPRPGISVLYEVDVPGNEFKMIQEFDYDLYSAVWGHQPRTVVHPAEHPSYQLLQTDLANGKSHVLISDSRRISTPRRINNGKDYLFASYLYNRDITIENYAGPDFNSAVMDYLPEFSNDASKLAFVSKRSGFSEVLVLSLQSGELVTLKTEDQGITYYNLSWSPDDAMLAANTSKGILLYTLDELSHRILPIDQLTYAVDWYSVTQLSYSQYLDGQWRATLRHIHSDELTALPDGVIFSLTDSGRHLNVYSGRAEAAAQHTNPESHYDLTPCGVRYLARFQAELKFYDGRVFCPDPDNRDQLLVVEGGKPASVYSDAFARAEFYTVSEHGLATARAATASSDVMRTRAEN